MSLADIAGMPVSEIAATDAHLYLWTTNRYLRDAYDIAEAWGFAPAKPLVWCKQPRGSFMGGPYGGSSIEFCLFARRGNLKTTGRAGRQWWECSRGAHSVKPAAFGDIIESVSPGPYVELFARQPRLGWDAWGHGFEIGAAAKEETWSLGR
jgi:N6-adenosine-specific RNA methylase IME4